MLSIIIPALNEEKYLPLLLTSIKNQNFDDNFEIIVADAGSKDKTVEIAKKYGCKVVLGGFPPAKGKNRGAEASKGDLILFLDADTNLVRDSLKKFLTEFKGKKLDIASFSLAGRQKFHDISYNVLYNFSARMCGRFLPQAMNAILIKREIHQKISGFDEEIKIGEELYYIRRASVFGKFGFLSSAKIIASSRRFYQDGWFKTWLKYFLCQLHIIFFGPVKSDILNYKFNHYSKDLDNKVL